jgi:hypothetical protein
VKDRLAGLLLFLPVPAVLALFTRQPFGPWTSLGLGLALMSTHRLYARPFALARASERCLWCGGGALDGPVVDLEEPSGRTGWRACRADHAALLGRTMGWAARRRLFLMMGILGSLAVFLLGSAVVAAGFWPILTGGDAVALFQVGVGATVLPLGWLGPRGPHGTPGRLPFPLHIQALIGTVFVLWLFRLVGLWWLVAGAAHLVRHLGG